jgi:predicted transcriptional regulator of viral defense system
MSFLEFRQKFYSLACFNTNQVFAWDPGFDRNNLSRWSKNGLIISLRQGYYTFPEYISLPDYPFLFANIIYSPSYISLYSALSFYGMIPESVLQITSVSSLKTASFKNNSGVFTYRSVKDELMFGYTAKQLAGGRSFHIATPEKAILDLLYLYPFYNSINEMVGLRIDAEWLNEELNVKTLGEYNTRFSSKALTRRVKLFLKAYEL